VTSLRGPAREGRIRIAVVAVLLASVAGVAATLRRPGDAAAAPPVPVPAAAAPAAAAPAAPVETPPADRWRQRAGPPADVPAGTLARMASRSGVPVDRGPVCPPRAAAEPAPSHGPAPAAAPGCTQTEEVLDVEMDWHEPPGPR